jgi:hypothetical protein
MLFEKQISNCAFDDVQKLFDQNPASGDRYNDVSMDVKVSSPQDR